MRNLANFNFACFFFKLHSGEKVKKAVLKREKNECVSK